MDITKGKLKFKTVGNFLKENRAIARAILLSRFWLIGEYIFAVLARAPFFTLASVRPRTNNTHS